MPAELRSSSSLIFPVDSRVEFNAIARVANSVFTLQTLVQRVDGSYASGRTDLTCPLANESSSVFHEVPAGRLIYCRASAGGNVPLRGDGYVSARLLVGNAASGPRPWSLIQGPVDSNTFLHYPGRNSDDSEAGRLDGQLLTVANPGAGSAATTTLSGFGLREILSVRATIDNTLGSVDVNLGFGWMIGGTNTQFVLHGRTVAMGSSETLCWVRGVAALTTAGGLSSASLGDLTVPPGSVVGVFYSVEDPDCVIQDVTIFATQYRRT